MQSLMSIHILCFLGGMRKKNISILLFCSIFLWCGLLACASAQSDQDILSHNLCFLGVMRKKYFYTLILWYFLWCGALACASVQSDQDVLSPLILCSHMPQRSLFSWVSIFISIGVDSHEILLNIIKQNHCKAPDKKNIFLFLLEHI